MPADIEITINGGALNQWLEYSSSHDFDQATGTLDLKVSPQSDGTQMPVHVGDAISVSIGGRPVLTGNVREVDGDDEWQHDYRIVHARDSTADAVECTVGPQKAPDPPVGIADVMRQTLSGMNLSKIGVIDNVSPDQFQDGEVASAAIDEMGHTFFDRMARQRQCLLNTDGNGNYVIARNNGQSGSGALYRFAPGDPQSSLNNILKAKYRNTDFGRHNTTAVSAQHTPSDKNYWESQPKDVEEAQSGPTSKEMGVVNDSDVRQERTLHVRSQHALKRDKVKGAAAWRSNVAKARGFQYICTVAGFTQDSNPATDAGETWWPGIIIPIVDYKYEIEGEFLLIKVQFHKTWSGGSTTELTFTYPDAYSMSEGGTSGKTGRTSDQGVGAPSDQGDASSGDLTTEDTTGEDF